MDPKRTSRSFCRFQDVIRKHSNSVAHARYFCAVLQQAALKERAGPIMQQLASVPCKNMKAENAARIIAEVQSCP